MTYSLVVLPSKQKTLASAPTLNELIIQLSKSKMPTMAKFANLYLSGQVRLTTYLGMVRTCDREIICKNETFRNSNSTSNNTQITHIQP